MFRHPSTPLLILFLGFSWLVPGWAQTPPLFADSQALEITLAGDLNAVFRDNGEAAEWHRAELIWSWGEDSGRIPVEMRTRGNFRRRRNICSRPPLHLKFDDEDTEGTPFAGQSKLKLVTHCRDRKAYEQNVLREYLAYRAYQYLTPIHFRTRLLRIDWYDAASNESLTRSYGFVIERPRDLAERLGGSLNKIEGIHPESMNPYHVHLVAIFNYFIGNTDFSIAYQHNIKLLDLPDYSGPVPVPYDFDQSGVVNAVYAEPQEKLGIQDVKQRLFRGFCRPLEEFEAVFDLFQRKRQAIFSVVNQQAGLSPGSLRYINRYFSGFYQTIERPREVEREFLGACRE